MFNLFKMKKQEIRTKYKTKRKELDQSYVELKSDDILKLIEQNLDLKDKKISIFLPIEKFNEINTFKIIEQLESNIIAVPKTNFEELFMEHYVYEGKKNLEISKIGILEPNNNNKIQDEEFDIVFVPLLAIDKNGYRVGYGKGFYDTFLAKCNEKCVFIGLNIFEETEEIDDIFELDIPLDLCITPSQIIRYQTIKTLPFK